MGKFKTRFNEEGFEVEARRLQEEKNWNNL
jgi:hypothetical protein